MANELLAIAVYHRRVRLALRSEQQTVLPSRRAHDLIFEAILTRVQRGVDRVEHYGATPGYVRRSLFFTASSLPNTAGIDQQVDLWKERLEAARTQAGKEEEAAILREADAFLNNPNHPFALRLAAREVAVSALSEVDISHMPARSKRCLLLPIAKALVDKSLATSDIPELLTSPIIAALLAVGVIAYHGNIERYPLLAIALHDTLSLEPSSDRAARELVAGYVKNLEHAGRMQVNANIRTIDCHGFALAGEELPNGPSVTHMAIAELVREQAPQEQKRGASATTARAFALYELERRSTHPNKTRPKALRTSADGFNRTEILSGIVDNTLTGDAAVAAIQKMLGHYWLAEIWAAAVVIVDLATTRLLETRPDFAEALQRWSRRYLPTAEDPQPMAPSYELGPGLAMRVQIGVDLDVILGTDTDPGTGKGKSGGGNGHPVQTQMLDF